MVGAEGFEECGVWFVGCCVLGWVVVMGLRIDCELVGKYVFDDDDDDENYDIVMCWMYITTLIMCYYSPVSSIIVLQNE